MSAAIVGLMTFFAGMVSGVLGLGLVFFFRRAGAILIGVGALGMVLGWAITNWG
jgi:hypothetical protein